MSVDVYSIMNDRILKVMERGVVPWKKPWSGIAPVNYDTDKEYRGVNTIILYLEAQEKGYRSPYWLTYNQANKNGGHVRRGQKSTPIVFSQRYAKEIQKEDGTKEIRVRHVLRYYNVFNFDQCDGLKTKTIPRAEIEQDKLAACEKLLAKMPGKQPSYAEGGYKAFYRPDIDHVQLPPLETFKTVDDYVATKLHEFGHATGHSTRLNRPGIMDVAMFGSEDYSFEELVAELTSAYLCAVIGADNSETVENSAAYLQGWMKVLKKDKRMLLKASGKAVRAADFIQGKKMEAVA
jgi:antirestriction protein ArdC